MTVPSKYSLPLMELHTSELRIKRYAQLGKIVFVQQLLSMCIIVCVWGGECNTKQLSGVPLSVDIISHQTADIA